MEVNYSIITINSNSGDFLSACLKSVSAQQDVSIEHIIQDNYSTDNSDLILKEAELRDTSVKVFYDLDSGPSNGLNRALRKVNGEFLLFLNADDMLKPNILGTVLPKLRRSSSDVFLGCGEIIDAYGETLRRHCVSNFSLLSYAFGGSVPLHQSTIYRTSFIRKNLLHFNERNGTCWDAEFLVDAVNLGAQVEELNFPIGRFRIHGGSITGSGRLNDEYSADQKRLFSKIMGRKLNFLDYFLGFSCRLSIRLVQILTHRH